MWPIFDKCSTKLDIVSQQGTLEHISTIGSVAESLGTVSQGRDEPIYDTDNTDLNSDYDEAELRRELMKDKLRTIFDAMDPEGFGEIAVDDFTDALRSPEIQAQVPINKRELLYERAMKAKKYPGTVSFDDFVNVGPVVQRKTTVVSEEIKERVKGAVDMLNQYLVKGSWVAGSNLSLADLSLLTSVSAAVEFGLSLDAYENVKDWYERAQSLPGWDENIRGTEQLVQHTKALLTEELKF